MLTRPKANESEADADAKAVAEAKIVLIFSDFDPILSKNRNFRSIFDGTSKIRLKTGCNVETLLVNTLKTNLICQLTTNQSANVADYCSVLTVKHILVNCPNLQDTRLKFFIVSSL